MTGMDKAVRRSTVDHYRITITGAHPDPTGRKLVVELSNNGHGDLIRIREARRRKWVTFDVATLYRKGIIAEVAAEKRSKKRRKA